MQTPPPVQLTYPQYLYVAQVGMLASSALHQIDTHIADDPSGNGIGFGLAVCRGFMHGDRSACLGQLSGTQFLGATVADVTEANVKNVPTLTDHYIDSENMGVMVMGDLWVQPATAVAVTVGADVYFNTSTGVFSANPTDVSIGADARWMTTPANDPRSNGLAVLRLGLHIGH
jgi:hypothetical protein